MAQSLAWQLMRLLVSLHLKKNLSVEQIFVLISCFILNFTRESGVKKLKPSTETDLKNFGSQYGFDVADSIECLVEQSYLIRTNQGYIINSPDLVKQLARH
jgi:hypothetical protein